MDDIRTDISDTLAIRRPPDFDADVDSLLEHFVRVTLPAPEAGHVGFYTDALRNTLLARLAALRVPEEPSRKSSARPLVKWRLRRVEAYVEANLGSKITLAALAQVAGVSRMYFAAQFRAATGMRPHSYLIHRRIALAKKMLSVPGTAIVDIALSVGFQTQAHFTTVFKRTEGVTPCKWRRGARKSGMDHAVAAEAIPSCNSARAGRNGNTAAAA